MNVGILTFPNSISYGAVLQMYALYHTVDTLGHTPEVINYQNAYMKQQKHVVQKAWYHRFLGELMHHRMYRKFRQFERKWMVKYPQTAISNPQDMNQLTMRYQAVICGSDQVWNPVITGGDLSYFLNFCDAQTKRVAYAPSFGLSEIPKDFADTIREDLEKFHALSVREAPGQEFLAGLLGKNAELVCDPTFLMNAEEWGRMEKLHPAACGEYVFYYTIRSSASLWNKCKAFAREKGLKIVAVGGNLLTQWKHRNENITYAVDISPEEWLYLLHHARYVFTNSFHGTAFSINYRKDFYVELSSMTNSRLIQITQMLGLSGQIVGQEPPTGAAVDYSFTDQILPQFCKTSKDYLSAALR